MGYSQKQKQENHDRIVAIAAQRFRERGLDGLSVAELMQEAGLTHGGFYSHFASRKALVLEALAFAFREDEQRLLRAMRRREGRTIDKFLDIYLSPAHRDTPGRGCTLAAIAPEAARRDAGVRALFTRQVERYGDLLGAESGLASGAVTALVSAAVGALTLSRAVDSKDVSDSILADTRNRMRVLASL